MRLDSIKKAVEEINNSSKEFSVDYAVYKKTDILYLLKVAEAARVAHENLCRGNHHEECTSYTDVARDTLRTALESSEDPSRDAG